MSVGTQYEHYPDHFQDYFHLEFTGLLLALLRTPSFEYLQTEEDNHEREQRKI